MPSLSIVQRRAIDRAKEILVGKAEALLDDNEVIRSGTFGHSQLRNLLAVAAETESPAVVHNFIRYQMGRDKKDQKGWARGAEGSRLGDRFIAELSAEPGAAVGAALAAIPDLADQPLLRQLAHIELIRNFLGFAGRYLRYLELAVRATDGEDPR